MQISYIGMQTQEVVIKPTLKVVLKSDSQNLDEVVVTAMGIKRSEKSLGYAVSSVKGDEITKARESNVLNSLSGKIAGLQIAQSSGTVGGSSSIQIRGASSIGSVSSPLFIIDGLPIDNGSYNPDRTNGIVDVGNRAGDINSDDIESINVLKGAAATALYGARAKDGAIVITTKKGKEGKARIIISNNSTFSNPFIMPEFQNSYINRAGSFASWGDKASSLFGTYEPKDFFNTGTNIQNNVSLSVGNEKNQTYLSVGTTNATGIIQNSKYDRYNFTFRNTTKFLKDKMTLDVGFSYIIQEDLNLMAQGEYFNPLPAVYLFPRGDDFGLVKVFERWDPARKINTMFWPQGEGDYRMQNPYWIAYRNLRLNQKKRYMLSAQLSYDITDWLNISGRVRVDNTHTKYEQKLYASSNLTITEESTQGHYTISKPDETQTYADVLANINKRFNDFSLVANVGASIVNNRYEDLSYRGPIREKGIPNVFNVFDLDNTKKKARQDEWQEQTQSVFASVEVGWKSMLYLTLTGRNDWASQLANSSTPCFFYPSVGLSGVISEMLTLPEFIDYMKVRGSFSSVGMPYPRNLTSPTYEYDEANQQWKPKTHYPIKDLKPERTNSWELGLDMRLFKDFSLGFSWYLANTFNQTFDPKVSVSSGYSKIYLQTGYVRNSGVELSLGYGHTWNNHLHWESNFTLSHNKNTIKDLVTSYIHPETGLPITQNRLDVGGLGKARFILKKGGTLGDLYTQSDLKRDNSGMVEIDPSGALTTEDNLPDIKLGSVFPKANLAWNNRFEWRGISLSALFTARIGGIAYSATQAAMDQYGVSERSAQARDNGGVLLNGRTLVDAQTYYSLIGNSSGLPQYYTYSATNVRLQEASVGYTIPRKWLGGVCDINVSVVGRNLWMIYCRAPFDPEAVANTGNYYQGIDNFMLPSTRNIGVNVKINF